MSLNSITLSGYLGADSDLRYTNNNLAVLNFSLAVGESVPDGKGSYKERTDWIDCVMFGKRADSLAVWLQKGSKISLTGRLHTSVYEKDGIKRKLYKVKVENVELMQHNQKKTVESDPGLDSSECVSVYENDVPF